MWGDTTEAQVSCAIRVLQTRKEKGTVSEVNTPNPPEIRRTKREE